jgi:hypothetical protein
MQADNGKAQQHSYRPQSRDAEIGVSGAAYCLGRSGVGIEAMGTA